MYGLIYVAATLYDNVVATFLRPLDNVVVRAHFHVRGYARGLRVKVQPRGWKRNVNRPRTAYMEMRPNVVV